MIELSIYLGLLTFGIVVGLATYDILKFVLGRIRFAIANRIYGWTEWKWLIPLMGK